MYLTQLLDMKDAFRDNWNLENQIALRLYQLTLQFQPGPHLLIGECIQGFNNNRRQCAHYFSIRRSA